MDFLWGKSTFLVFLKYWFNKFKSYFFKDVSGFIYWNLWKLRNVIFFDSIEINADLVVGRIIKAYRELASDSGKAPKSLKREPIYHSNSPWCFFDGACQDGRCAGGIFFHLSDQHSIIFNLE